METFKELLKVWGLSPQTFFSWEIISWRWSFFSWTWAGQSNYVIQSVLNIIFIASILFHAQYCSFYIITFELYLVLQDCVALLAYEEPQKSSVGYLLEHSHREVVADAVNSMVLSTNPNLNESQICLHSYLEKLIRQLTACCLERRALNGDQGDTFNLHRELTADEMGKN